MVHRLPAFKCRQSRLRRPATATTDAGGHFTILSLAPDTYTLNSEQGGLSKRLVTRASWSLPTRRNTVAYSMSKALETIAHVTSQARRSLVKPGVGSDLYSVNAAQASAAAAPLGGGGNLNNAYSAMASVPGVQTSRRRHGLGFQRCVRSRTELVLYGIRV